MLKQLKGYVKFSVKGKNLNKFINALHRIRIHCFNQYCKNEIFYGEIYHSDLKKIAELSRRYKVEIEYYEYETIHKKLSKYKLRYGIIIGSVMFLVISFYFSNTVMMIEIQGNANVKDSVILSVLDGLGLRKGVFIGGIDWNTCERELRLRVDDIAWSGIRRTGNRIVVEVTEIDPKPKMLHERIPCNIVAERDAQITHICVLNGELMRCVGDVVRKGDILVSGIYADSNGHLSKYHALAEITGTYEETVRFTQPYVDITLNEGKNVANERYLNMFNLYIPLFIGKNNFKLSKTEETVNSLSLFGKSLPIGIVKRRVTEQKHSEKHYSKDDAENKIMEKMFYYEKNFLNKVTVIDRKITAQETEDSLIFEVTYSLEGEIGTQHEIYMK